MGSRLVHSYRWQLTSILYRTTAQDELHYCQRTQ